MLKRACPMPPGFAGDPMWLHACSSYHPNGQAPGNGNRQGAIVGIVTFSKCVTRSDSPLFTGPYGWVIGEAEAVKPAPYAERGVCAVTDYGPFHNTWFK